MERWGVRGRVYAVGLFIGTVSVMETLRQWRTQEFCSGGGGGFKKLCWGQGREEGGIWGGGPTRRGPGGGAGVCGGGGGGVQQIQLRTEDRENGDLGAVAP